MDHHFVPTLPKLVLSSSKCSSQILSAIGTGLIPAIVSCLVTTNQEDCAAVERTIGDF